MRSSTETLIAACKELAATVQCDDGVANMALREIAERLQEQHETLAFFFGQMQMHSPHMGGEHSYRFRSGGWPMTHCKGPTAEIAVKRAVEEVNQARKEWSVENEM